MRCLLVEHPDGLVLIDTGLGNKDDAKFHDIYGIENRGSRRAHPARGLRWPSWGFAPTTCAGDQHASPLRPRRRQHLRRRCRTGSRCGRRSPTPPTWCSGASSSSRATPTSGPRRATSRATSSRCQFTAGCRRGAARSCRGSAAWVTPGHVPYHQSVLIESGGETALFPGRPHPHDRPSPAPVDHGVRPRAAA